MYIKILDYLINTLTNLRENARTPHNKGMTAKEWALKQKKAKEKSYK